MLHSPVLEKPRFERRFETHSTGGPPAGATRNEGSFIVNDAIPSRPPGAPIDLSSQLAACLRELSLVSMYFDASFRVRLTKQLRNLLRADDWEEDDQPVDVASFRSFVRAMVLLEPRERPMLALTNDGNFVAMWGEQDHRLVIDFFSDDRLRWYVIDAEDKAVGTTQVERLLSVLSPFKVRTLLDGAG